MRSLLVKTLLPFLLLAAPLAAQTNPHTQIRWPANCNAANMVYTDSANTCMNAVVGPQIDPSAIISWPANCNAPNMAYNFTLNSCYSTLVYISAGTTTNLPPGSQATVTQTGTYPNYTLNFGIPMGTPGGSLSYPGVTTDNANGLAMGGGITVGTSVKYPDGTVQSSNTAKAVSSTLGRGLGYVSHADSWGTGTGTTFLTGQQNGTDVWGFNKLVADQVGGPFWNFSRPGDQCADQNYSWGVFANDNPLGGGMDPIYDIAVGVNDVTRYNSNTNQQTIYRRCMMAMVSFEAIQGSNKKFGQTGSLSGFVADTNSASALQAGLGVTSSTNGNTASYSIATVAGGGLCWWYYAADGNTGTFTVQVNGTLQADPFTASTTWNAFGDGSAAISTQNGTTKSVFGACVASPGTGNQTVLFTNTSSAKVEIYGVGASPTAGLGGKPLVLVRASNPRNDANDTYVPTFNTFVTSIVTQLAGYGLNVKYVDSYNALLNSVQAVTETRNLTSYAPPGWLSNIAVYDDTVPPGVLMTQSAGAPAAGQYQLTGSTYLFNIAQNNVPIRISYNMNGGGGSESTLFANCYYDTLHVKNACHSIVANAYLAQIPAAMQQGSQVLKRTSQVLQSFGNAGANSPNYFWSPNPYNLACNGYWCPGVSWTGSQANISFTAMTGGAGVATYGPSASAPIWSVCSYQGYTPSAQPSLGDCKIDVVGNGIVEMFPNAARTASTFSAQNGAVFLGLAPGIPFTSAGVNSFYDIYAISPTAATSGANFQSKAMAWRSAVWTGSIAAIDDIGFRNIPGSGANPATVLTLFHSTNGDTSVPSIDLTAATGGVKLPANTTFNGGQSGVTGSLGGSALAANACSIGNVVLSGVSGTSRIIVTPNVDPNGYSNTSATFWWYGVNAGGQVTVKVCALAAGTPPATTYNVTVIN
jgi:hypothetical protein